MKLRVGTRGSLLAVKQTQDIINLLSQSIPDSDISYHEIQTQGDIDLKSSFQEMNAKSVFTKELDDALLSGIIDIAVHSLKDLPSMDTAGLNLSLVTHVSDPRDVWVARDKIKFSELSNTSKIGTSSIRRQTILKEINPHFHVEGLRGNLSTRLKKLQESHLDGIILAAAGLIRLGWHDYITDFLPVDVFVPAAGQGMIGVVTRKDDSDINDRLKRIQDPLIWKTSFLQRQFMHEMDGGCRVPLGFWIDSQASKNMWMFHGYLSNADSTRVIRHTMETNFEKSSDDLKLFIQHFKNQGSEAIIQSLRSRV